MLNTEIIFFSSLVGLPKKKRPLLVFPQKAGQVSKGKCGSLTNKMNRTKPYL